MKTKEGWTKFIVHPSFYDAWVDEVGEESAARQFVRMEKLIPCEIGVIDGFVIREQPKHLEWRFEQRLDKGNVNPAMDQPIQYPASKRTLVATASLQAMQK